MEDQKHRHKSLVPVHSELRSSEETEVLQDQINARFFFTYIPVLLLRITTPMHVVASSVPTNYNATNILTQM